jgi:hypothetical protein
VLGWRIQSILTIHATKFSPATPLFDPTEGGSRGTKSLSFWYQVRWGGVDFQSEKSLGGFQVGFIGRKNNYDP